MSDGRGDPRGRPDQLKNIKFVKKTHIYVDNLVSVPTRPGIFSS